MLDLDSLIPFYGDGEDELNLAFNFLFVHAELDADELRAVVEGVEEKLPAGAWPVYTGSNHDAGRLATRWAGDDARRARRRADAAADAARHAVPLLRRRARRCPRCRPTRRPRSTRSARRDRRPVGQPRRVPHADAVDRRARRRVHDRRARRRGCRSATSRACNVAAQREDPGSTLHLVRDLIALRRGAAT